MQIIKDAAVISCGEKQKYLVMLDLKSESLTGITNIDQIQIPNNEKSGLDLYRPDNCYTLICYAGGYYSFASIVKCKLVACSVAEKTFKKLADIRYCNDTGNLARPDGLLEHLEEQNFIYMSQSFYSSTTDRPFTVIVTTNKARTHYIFRKFFCKTCTIYDPLRCPLPSNPATPTVMTRLRRHLSIHKDPGKHRLLDLASFSLLDTIDTHMDAWPPMAYNVDHGYIRR